MWQPIGVVVASAIAYGTAARYRCDVDLPSCKAADANGASCCTTASNMGWRYMVLVIGAITLTVFFSRYLIFPFYESPKFLLSKGREQEAIDILHKIAKFNGAEPPTLTTDNFREAEQHPSEGEIVVQSPPAVGAKSVVKSALRELGFLRNLIYKRTQCVVFLILAVGYMVCPFPSIQKFSTD